MELLTARVLLEQSQLKDWDIGLVQVKFRHCHEKKFQMDTLHYHNFVKYSIRRICYQSLDFTHRPT